MPYCTYEDVRAIVDTTMTNAEITEIIEEIDAIINMKLDLSGLTVHVLRAISRLWTAIRCMLKDPESMALGELRYDRSYALEKLNEELDGYIKLAEGGMSFAYGYARMPRDPS